MEGKEKKEEQKANWDGEKEGKERKEKKIERNEYNE